MRREVSPSPPARRGPRTIVSVARATASVRPAHGRGEPVSAPSRRATRSRPALAEPAGTDYTGLAKTVELGSVRRPRARWLLRAVVGAVLVAGLVIGGTAFRVWQVARVDDRRPVAF